MKKKCILTAVLTALMALSMISLTACKEDETVYDAGKYGEIKAGSENEVIPDAGYCFIGWSEPVKEGHKIIYNAQYEHIEYYLSEEKDVYEFDQGYHNGPSIMYRVTNMQTNATEEKIMSLFYVDIEYSEPHIISIIGDCFQTNLRPYEFDITAKVTVDDSTYNFHKEFNLHFVRNRIPAESISVNAWSQEGANCVSKDDPCTIDVTTVPDNASYKECEFQILSIIRDGQEIDESLINTIAYIHAYFPDLYVTEKAESGDLIYVKVFNKRDPQVMSEVLEIIVY